jgi:hypothetical protein
MARHHPMHPQTAEGVTVEATATGKVNWVQLAYERYTLSTAPDGSRLQTLAEAETIAETCDPPSTVSTLTCSHTFTSFPDNSLIRFKATAKAEGSGSATETYDFAAGAYPWPDDPIPIRVKGATGDHLDVVFVPDTDITLAAFRGQLENVVQLYFNYDDLRTWRGLHNYYYSGQQGHYAELCSFTNPPNMANLTAVGDVVAILHQANLRDCRSGTVMSSEVNNEKSLIHESGHALFDLTDEYCCDSSYSQSACVPNVWSSLAACQADAPGISGLSAASCTQICSAPGTCISFWRADPTGATGCMMGPSQHQAGSTFGPACRRRISWRYGKCLNGTCMSGCP